MELKSDLATFGLYTNRRDADIAITKLEKNGFARSDISLLAPEASGSRDFVYQQRTSIKEGAWIGATIGFFVLGFVGFMLGLMDPTPGAMPTWLLSLGVGCLVGLLFGAASGALVGIGTPQSVAKRYGFYLKEGGIMLSVHLKNETERLRANQILEKTRAQDISELKESEIWKTIVPEKNKLIYN